MRLTLRAQVVSHLVKQLANAQLPIQTWHWLRKLRLHAPAWVAARLRRRSRIAKSGWSDPVPNRIRQELQRARHQQGRRSAVLV